MIDKNPKFIFYSPRIMTVPQNIVFDQFHRSQMAYLVFSDELQGPKLLSSSSFDYYCQTSTSVVEKELLLF